MPDQTAPPHGVMEGKGAYNRYAKLPAGGAVLALPLLEGAVRRLELDTNDQTVVIADYGSSQGKNSMVPMDIAIRGRVTTMAWRTGGCRATGSLLRSNRARSSWFDLLPHEPGPLSIILTSMMTCSFEAACMDR